MKTLALWQQHVGVPILRLHIPRSGGVAGMLTCSLPLGSSVVVRSMDVLSGLDSVALNGGDVVVLAGKHGLGSNSSGVGSQGFIVII
jgi:hypothetical protein